MKPGDRAETIALLVVANFCITLEFMALRPASLAGLSRRVMATNVNLATRSGGGGPIALGKPASQPVGPRY